MITADQARALINYDPESGVAVWRERDRAFFKSDHDQRVWNTRYAGAPIRANRRGYVRVSLFNRSYMLHRVAWLIAFGVWPDEVDHINGDPQDNRIVNLRSVTHAENQKNQRRSAANKSGVTGVVWHRGHARWRAQINTGGRVIHLGEFRTIEAAAAARRAAERQFAFHTNHGQR